MESNAPAEIVIPLDKSKVALLLLGAIVFVGGSIWIWSIADTQTRYNPLIAKAVAIAGISFFALCAIYGCFKLFDSRPGLIIDSQGIVDHSSAVAAGRIFWHDITGIKIWEISGQRFITIQVVDPHRFIDRANFFKRLLSAANSNLTGSPINIASHSLRIELDALLQELAAALEKYKGASRIYD